ncbi:DUF5103 domain-containing protein [Flavobacterium sp. I3-2]|uniref:type IX secretion system plug protein n=1 Tax=Flavobacterium sp. I3-2 TaxID=2748319 RepID=UPI001C49E08F|nr:DUF5103 domain-containing protein [Flavobacterium sp. I3-2]
MFRKKIVLFFMVLSFQMFAQKINEVAPPYYIKSISVNTGAEAVYPMFRLGDYFNIEFDDLLAQSSNYFYKIKHCNADWTPSNLQITEYLGGFNNMQILNFQNSFNTLQNYTHYKFTLPNSNSRFLISGNYIIEVLDDDGDVMFSKKIIVFQEEVSVGVTIKRTRNNATIDSKQNVGITIDYNAETYNNPKENFKIAIMQNGRFDNAITNVPPQYTLGNQFIYNYDTETQFFAGNEYLYFDNSNINQVNNNIAKITSTDIYNTYLYPLPPRGLKQYSYYEDVNGTFLPKNKFRNDAATEADYSWVYFNLPTEEYVGKDVYVVGMVDNYLLTDSNKLEYDTNEKAYKKAILLKQGFTSYLFSLVDSKTQKIDYKDSIDGNFYQTENDYQVIVYYRGIIDRSDRVIGFGGTKSLNITN